MMKKAIHLFKAAILLMVIVITQANAQKLKQVQEGSMLAPAKVKIDGKLDEWGEQFQAYNKTTKTFYSVANDDKNLYLIVRSTDVLNSAKIMGGGITFTINTTGKKKEENAYSITFPVVSRANMRGIRRPRGATANTVMDSASMAEAAAARKQAIAAIKEINVLGFKDITDTTISIYNEYGIKAAANYNEKADLQVELAIPLSLLKISAENPKEFAYNLKVNGIQMGGRNPGGAGGRDGGGQGGPPTARGGGFGGGGGGRGGGGGFGGGGAPGGGGPGGGGPGGNNDQNDMLTATDFWGKYILAKK